MLKLTLELADPKHKCEKCSLSEKCKDAYRKIVEMEMHGESIFDDFDEFCYPLIDGDDEDCLIRKEARKILDGDEKSVAAE